MIIKFCERCGKKLEIRPHRRTNLCEFCYEEKRREDIKINVSNMRSKVKASKPRKIEDKFLFIAMSRFRFLGYKITDWVWDDPETNSGFIELEGRQDFHSIPIHNNFCDWAITYTVSGNTRINYSFDTRYELNATPEHGRARLAMDEDLKKWQVDLTKEIYPQYKDTSTLDILNIMHDWADKNMPMPKFKTKKKKLTVENLDGWEDPIEIKICYQIN